MAAKKQKSEVKWEGVITNIQSNVLGKLARYKYLTLSQILKLEEDYTKEKDNKKEWRSRFWWLLGITIFSVSTYAPDLTNTDEAPELNASAIEVKSPEPSKETMAW